MAYRYLDDRIIKTRGAGEDGELDLSSAVVRFLRESCEDLRFDDQKERQEREEGRFLGRSMQEGQIPYHMQMDLDRLCLEQAMRRFLDSGASQDAFDVYYCYLEMFVGSYGSTKRMIEMLSEFETNGSSLLMKHRDHYSHSVYVFALGLAVYETNPVFRETYQRYYGFDASAACGEHNASHHFLQYWGLCSLFHDIGYPFELPFEQVEAYFEVNGEERKDNPFLAYIGLERFVALPPDAVRRLKELYGKTFVSTDELFAYDIAEKLGNVYRFTRESIETILTAKAVNPNRFGYFMDHAYFSASVLFQELYAADQRAGRCDMNRERIDALTAILLHNSLYKFSVAFYKGGLNIPLEMKLHPLAYLLMLCDELQCWDRTSYGRNSRTELHPMDCRLTFCEGSIRAVYLYDEAEREKIDRYEKLYAAWDKTDPKRRPALKAYASMVHENTFLGDIKKIVNTEALGLTAETALAPARYEKKHRFLSDSNFIHLYQFAVALNGRYSYQGREQETGVTERLEREFGGLSLEYQLLNIGQAKAFSRYLDAVGCFYTDQPVGFEMVTAFTEEDMQVIGPLEHERWLTEHQAMGWSSGTDYATKGERERKRIHALMIDGEITKERAAAHYAALSKEEQEKDTAPMNCMLGLLRQFEGLRIYRL